MKQFDSRNIDRRAGKLLNYHMGLLENQKLQFIPEGENYYLYQSSREDYIKIGYNKKKKLLSRTFNLEFKSVIFDIDYPESFFLKLRFRGFPDIRQADFSGSKNSRNQAAIFQDKELINRLLHEVKKVEIAYVYIQYDRRLQKVEIRVCPYAGAYLWVIFPPVFYDMRLKQAEVEAVYRIVQIITDYVNRTRNRPD